MPRQKVIELACVKCTENQYINNTIFWDRAGNCAPLTRITEHDMALCARLPDGDNFWECLLSGDAQFMND
jgi:hypothetical protein